MIKINLKNLTILAFLAVLSAISLTAVGAGNDTDNSSIEWGVMAMQLFGGLALFLFGMEQMADALKAVAGDRMRNILAKLTTNRFMGATTGALVTAVIQSSSVTTVLVVGFISAGLMTLSQSAGIIMGANVGTTITAQIVAFKVTKAALLMIGVGFTMLFAGKKESIKHYGGMLMGLGMVFFGMSVMSDSMKPLRTFQPFLDLMINMESPLIGILVAAVFTSLIQSSSATTGIVIVMASQGFITLGAGIALAFGANIGTCVTALLASIGKSREALRAAMVHVFFNIGGVLIWILFIPQLVEFVTWFSPSNPELTGIERLSADTPRQIANAHTIFNLANTFIFIWFTTQIVALVEKILPDLDQQGESAAVITAKHLDESLLITPSFALAQVRLEILHMGERVEDMVVRIMPAVLHSDQRDLEQIAEIDDEVNILYEQIVDYLGRLSKQNLTDSQMEEFLSLMEAITNLENIGDIVKTNMVKQGIDRIDAGISISKETTTVLNNFQEMVVNAVKTSILAVVQNNSSAAISVVNMDAKIEKRADDAAIHFASRLIADEPNRIAAYTIEVDIIEKQKRIYYFAKRIARTVVSPGEAD